MTVNLESEIATADTHSCPFEFLERANLSQGRNLTDGMVVFGNGLVSIGDLSEEIAPLQIGQLFLGPKDWHVT